MEIGIWGDSITYGGPNEGWVGLLRKFSSSFGVDVYNRGICGDTSEDILKRFEVEAGAIEPGVIVFAVGTNDSKYPKGKETNKVSIDRFEDNMKKLINSARNKCNRVIIIGLTGVDEDITKQLDSKFINDEIEKYGKSLREIAAKEGVEFIQMSGVLNRSSDLEDGLHPNDQGYIKMFEVISRSFKQVATSSQTGSK